MMDLVSKIIIMVIVTGCQIQVKAYVCEVGQEKNGKDVWSWVLPYEQPCECTSVRLGGMNTRTPIRHFKPVYVNKPLLSNNIAKIRAHYGLKCKAASKPTTKKPKRTASATASKPAAEEATCTASMTASKPTTKKPTSTVLPTVPKPTTKKTTSTALATVSKPTTKKPSSTALATTFKPTTQAADTTASTTTSEPTTQAAETTTSTNCNTTIGVEDGTILDRQMTASSRSTSYFAPSKARLHSTRCWIPHGSDSNPWLNIQLDTVYTVAGIITQGFTINWVEQFYLRYAHPTTGVLRNVISEDKNNQLFAGNTDGDTPVINMFDQPVNTSAIQVEPQECRPFNGWLIGICGLRLELLSCKADATVDISNK